MGRGSGHGVGCWALDSPSDKQKPRREMEMRLRRRGDCASDSDCEVGVCCDGNGAAFALLFLLCARHFFSVFALSRLCFLFCIPCSGAVSCKGLLERE